MKIIGHRGAAGLALENTLPSIELAKLLGVDAIEFDVRMTKDKKLVLCHDEDLSRVSSSNAKIAESTLKELQTIKLRDDYSNVPTLHDALVMVGSTPVIIEVKVSDCAEELLKEIKKFPKLDITITSFKHDLIAELKRLDPTLRLYANEHTKPVEVVQFARRHRINGIGLNYWMLNPLTYILLKRYKMDLFVYTLNNRTVGHFVRLIYPEAAICTNHPEWYIKHPWLKLRSNHYDSFHREQVSKTFRKTRRSEDASIT